MELRLETERAGTSRILRRASIAIVVLVSVAALARTCWAQTAAERDALRARMNHDPNAAKLVTSDLPNFWKAWTQASAAATLDEKEKIYQTEYLDKGSAGLKEFVQERIESVKNLVAVTEKHPKYFAALKEIAPRVPQMEPAIRSSFRKLKELYSNAVFPDVYFLVGKMNSGGTTGYSGLLIGLEMHGKTPQTDMSEMDSWLKSVLGPVGELPGIVAHELIHYQQGPDEETLLAQSIHEGSADFIGQMISGQTLHAHLREYGDAHEAALWSEFSKDMKGKNFSRWLYEGDERTDRPADLGYYMGYRIAESYYQHEADKKQAIRDILTVTDYDKLLRESHYADKFAPPNAGK